MMLPAILPQIFLIDVEPDDFRFRLVGEAVNAHYDWRLKGRRIRELLDGDVLRMVLEEHRAVVERRAAVFTCNTEWSATLEDMQRYQRLLLPLASDGASVDRLLGAMAFETA